MYDEELLQQEHSKERHESAECPVCKSDTFLQPDLKLLVSPCYHKMSLFFSSTGTLQMN